MFEGQLKIKEKSIPRILLGTSPFIGAAQFGHRARLYQLDLYNHPENMVKIIIASYNLGVKGIQLIPYPPVVEAVKRAQEEGCDLSIIGTVRPDQELEDIELLSGMGADVMMLHAAITDDYHWDTLTQHLELIKETDSIAGLVTHLPYRTTNKLLESPILDLFNIYMIPVNKLGYLMDTDVFMGKEQLELAGLIKKLDKKVIIKKTLAAGILTPDDAFEFLKKVDYADSIAVGIASVAEAEETFNLLKEK